MTISIRKEQEKDIQVVSKLIRRAFKNTNQVILTEILRRKNDSSSNISIVAEINGIIAGHILFSKIQIQTEDKYIDTLWLEPVSVHPLFQHQGIGRSLIIKGLETIKTMGYNSVFVVGSNHYYSKFGFQEASNFGIESSLSIPREALLAMELTYDSLKDIKGKLMYPEEMYE